MTLARELNSLSLQERNRVFESIHGVDDVIKETPEMLEEKLQEFQKVVDRIENSEGGSLNVEVPLASRSAYLQAKRQDESYVSNRTFRLMFLRAEGFHAPLAVQRMMVYLEEKLSRFGSHVLTKTLTINDLSPQSRALLVDFGIHQILPARDSAGRAIYLVHVDDGPREVVRENPMAAVSERFLVLFLQWKRNAWLTWLHRFSPKFNIAQDGLDILHAIGLRRR